MTWLNSSIDAIVLYSDMAVCPKVLSDQYVRGWVYESLSYLCRTGYCSIITITIEIIPLP